MVTTQERRFIGWMIRLHIWTADYNLFGTVQVFPRWGTRWLFERLLRRQVVDDLHHAPCCPANHWCRRAFVFRRCNCGAKTHAQ
jgi:hypothetical protein